MNMNVHDSFICNRPKLEATQTFINKWMDSQMARYPHYGIAFSNKEEWTIDTDNAMGESQKNYVEWGKPEK